MTGPVAVILAAAERARLTSAETSSWIFGVFFLNGLLTIVASWLYQRPLAFFWTIPGSVVVGQAAVHLAWTDILGAYLVTAAVVLLVGLLVPMDRFMAVLPMPVVMAMVAGVFLPFGVDMVDAVADDWLIGAPMVAAFVLASLTSGVRSWLPPVLAALAAGVIAVLVAGEQRTGAGMQGVLATPVVQAPTFSWAATTELVVPLAVTVLLVQNAQGMAVLSAAGHRAPMRFTTLACGLWSVPAAAVGAVSTCLAGSTNALLTSSGRRERQYAAGLVCGCVALTFGVLAPVVVGGLLSMPSVFVAVLAGVALLKALSGAFWTAFSTASPSEVTAPLVTFVVTIAGVDIANLGAAFWGLVAGLVTWRLTSRPQRAGFEPPRR